MINKKKKKREYRAKSIDKKEQNDIINTKVKESQTTFMI